MLAYAASRPTPVERRPHPNTMLAIIAAHVAVAAVVMSAKMDLPDVVKHTPIDIFWVKPPDTTPPPDPLPTQRTHQSQSHQVDRVEPVVTTPPQGADPFDPGPITTVDPGPIAGAGTNIVTELPRPHLLVRLAPTLRTSPAELKPPYPPSKLLTEEEAVLRLKLKAQCSPTPARCGTTRARPRGTSPVSACCWPTAPPPAPQSASA